MLVKRGVINAAYQQHQDQQCCECHHNQHLHTEMQIFLTFLNVLILIKRHQSVILAQASESVDQVGAEVGVDVLRGELGVALPVDRPVGVVAHHLAVVDVLRGLSLLAQLCGHFS